MPRVLVIVTALAVFTVACRNTEQQDAGLEDFSLERDVAPKRQDLEEYYDRIMASDIQDRTSLPLPIRVGKLPSRFPDVPAAAKQPQPSIVHHKVGACSLKFSTGFIEIDRFIYAGKWIKLDTGLTPSAPLKLTPGMDLYLRITAPVKVSIDTKTLAECEKIYKGRLEFIGNFHLNESMLGLLHDNRSPAMRFTGRSSLEPQKKIFMWWGKKRPVPILLDDLNFPASLQSAIFHTKFEKQGYYYLTAKPALQLVASAIASRPQPKKKAGPTPAPAKGPPRARKLPPPKNAIDKTPKTPVKPVPKAVSGTKMPVERSIPVRESREKTWQDNRWRKTR